MADVASRPSAIQSTLTEYEANITMSPQECNISPPIRWREPIPYTVVEADRAKHTKRFINLPVRLASDGTLARLWEMCEVASSVLVALAIHRHPAPGALWTPEINLEAERLVTLSGAKQRQRVVEALRHLREGGYVDQTARAHPTDGRFRLRAYRVHSTIYARAGERYADIRAPFIYSLEWAQMPSNAHRHLYLTERLLARVQNVQAFLDRLPPGETKDVAERARRPRTVRELALASGLSVGAVQKVRSP